jgi:CO/xanthine dehydrogenase FAD-binding subunit
VSGGMLRIGATATLTQLLGQAAVPMLGEAASHTGSWPVRNMATIGGNLFTPPPGGDVAVALLALDAVLWVAGPRGERAIPIDEFHTGFMATALAPDELLARIEVPLPTRETAFLKFGRRAANTPAVVTVAVALTRERGRVTDARIALGAAGPHPVRARNAEAAIMGTGLEADAVERAAEAAAEESRPFTDAVASEWYRRRMVRVFVGRALAQVAGRGTGGNGTGPAAAGLAIGAPPA